MNYNLANKGIKAAATMPTTAMAKMTNVMMPENFQYDFCAYKANASVPVDLSCTNDSIRSAYLFRITAVMM